MASRKSKLDKIELLCRRYVAQFGKAPEIPFGADLDVVLAKLEESLVDGKKVEFDPDDGRFRDALDRYYFRFNKSLPYPEGDIEDFIRRIDESLETGIKIH